MPTDASTRLAQMVDTARAAGEIVEIKIPLFAELQPVAKVEPAGSEWIRIFLKGLPDVKHYVRIDSIQGIRVRPDDD